MNRKKLLGVLLIVFIIILTTLIITKTTLNFELWFYHKIADDASTAFIKFMKIITNFGSFNVIFALCLALLIIPFTKYKYGMPVTIITIISYLINIFLKNIFTRTRPDLMQLVTETSYSFPSGHAMINSAIYILLILLVWKNSKNKKLKILLTILLILLVILIGLSRIVLGVHYLGDILVGWLLGILLATIVYNNIDKIYRILEVKK